MVWRPSLYNDHSLVVVLDWEAWYNIFTEIVESGETQFWLLSTYLHQTRLFTRSSPTLHNFHILIQQIADISKVLLS